MSTQHDTTHAYPVLPIKNSVLYPHLLMPLTVGRPTSVAAVEAAMATEDKMLLVVTQNDPGKEDVVRDDLFHIGTLAVIKRTDRNDGVMHVFVHGTERFELRDVEHESPYLSVHGTALPHPAENGTEVDALHRECLELGGKISALLQERTHVPLMQVVHQTDDPVYQVYLMSSLLGFEIDRAKQLLAAATRLEVLRLAHECLTYELQVLQLRDKIATEASSEISREVRERLLREQMRAIQKELGEESAEQADVAELRRQMEEANLPEAVRAEAEKELTRLERMSAHAPDYQVTRRHLELLLEMPWHATTDDVLDLPHAREVLDEDHYGLKEVKERIV